MADELLPCPFCGSKAIWGSRYITYDTELFHMHCLVCKVHGPEFTLKAEAEAAWNTRALLSQEAKPVAQPVAWKLESLVNVNGEVRVFGVNVTEDRKWADMAANSVHYRVTPLYAAAPDEAKHRIEAFEEAAKACDANFKQPNFRDPGSTSYREGYEDACTDCADSVRALADRERG